MRSPRSPFVPPRRRLVAGILAVVASVAMAACDSESPAPTSGVSPTPEATTEATTAPGPTSTSGGPTSTSGGPSPTLTTATTAPSPSAPPDPRSVPLASLLRPGTQPLRVLYGDLDGDGTEDILVAAVRRSPPAGTTIAQAYLDVFLGDGQGHWPRAWEATGPAPPGSPGAPAVVVQDAGELPPSQQLDFVAVLDMRGDGSSELAVGVLNIGAGPGPLDIWVIGFGPDGPVNEFSESTAMGGILVAAGDRLRLQTPDYGPNDPACCPSRIEHQTIGFDPAQGKVGVLERTFTPVG